MTDIKEVIGGNVKKFRTDRGWSQAKLAEKVGASAKYISLIETKFKYPSSEMVHNLAKALSIDPTELFYKEIPASDIMRNTQKATIEDMVEATNQFFAEYIDKKAQVSDEESDGNGE